MLQLSGYAHRVQITVELGSMSSDCQRLPGLQAWFSGFMSRQGRHTLLIQKLKSDTPPCSPHRLATDPIRNKVALAVGNLLRCVVG